MGRSKYYLKNLPRLHSGVRVIIWPVWPSPTAALTGISALPSLRGGGPVWRA